MESDLEIICPCGSGKSFNKCCLGNTKLPESITKYELLSNALARTVDLSSNLLDSSDFQIFCNRAVDQFRLLIDHDQSRFDVILNSDIGCQLVIEWLLFLAPLSRSMEELNDNQELSETSSFVAYLLDSNHDFSSSLSIEILESDKATLNISAEQFVQDLLRGLSHSRLSIFTREDAIFKGLCIKDAVTGEQHYLHDRQLEEKLPLYEVFVGRVVHISSMKSLLTVYALPTVDKARTEILESCEKWHDLIESDSDFSVSDMQVNLLQFLTEYLT